MWGIIAGLTISRLIYLNFVPLVPQEAYYWMYAKHPALSYFDHPPLSAYIIMFFTWLGGDKVFWVRVGSVIFSAGSMLLIYHIAYTILKSFRLAVLTLIIMNCTVLFSLGAIIITPDVPLFFFWTLTVYALLKLSETANPRWWALVSFGFGAALLSKYTAVLLVP